MDTMVIIFKALALVPIGYALGLGSISYDCF